MRRARPTPVRDRAGRLVCPHPYCCTPGETPRCAYRACGTEPVMVMEPVSRARHTHWCLGHFGPAVDGQKYGSAVGSSPDTYRIDRRRDDD